MKKIIIPAIAIAFALAASSFTTKQTTSSFYLYTLTNYSQTNIQTASNYEAADPNCSGGSNVCGVQLTTAHTIGSAPVASEFNAEKADLWTSQQDGIPADGDIQMKN